MDRLTFAFLGNPTVYFEGQRLAFPTRQTLALLIYLVVEGGTHQRDKLATLFWPHYEATQGRAVLRTTLARLRKALGADDRYLIITPDTLGFDFNVPFELDLHILQSAIQALRLSNSPAPVLQQAADLYRGDFLEGFSLPDAPDFDDWVTFQRETWHYRIGLVFDRLSQWQAEAGDSPGAIETTRRWVTHHPFDESAHRRLVQLYLASGDRGAALQAYETCRTILEKELQLTPGPETEALVERIRTEAPLYPELATATPALPLQIELPLVGRSAEHLQLVAAYRTACHSRTQGVALVGEAGIGKTRLATEFLRWVIAQGAEVLQGRAFEAGGRLPYQPIVQALRPRLEQENAPDDLLADIWLTELSRLLPELRDRYPDLPAPIGEDVAAQGRLFEAVARFVEALAQRKPLIFFIDDIQWADVASLDLLHYATSRWAESGTPLLLLISLRREALDRANSPPAPTLLDWLTNLQRDLPLTRLTLEPLTAADTLQLVRSLASVASSVTSDEWQVTHEFPAPGPRHLSPNTPSPIHEFSEWLFRETGGQPFFMTETLKELIERRLLVVRPKEIGGWTLDFMGTMTWLETEQVSALIPPGVQELIRHRLARLSPNAFAFLTAGAVLGQGFEFHHLCQVAGLDEDEGLRALDELLPNQLLRPMAQRAKQSAPSLYGFSHDKIRDVVYAEASDARRIIFHRRAFEVLQAASASPMTLAHHALQAHLSEAAFRYSLAAGDEAMHLFAVRDAIAHYEQARVLATGDWRVRSLPAHRGPSALGPETGWATISTQGVQSPISNPKSARQRRAERGTQSEISPLHHLYTQLGRAYELDNQFENAQAHYEAMLAFAERWDQPNMVCEALNRLAAVVAWHGVHLDRAATLLQQALQLADSSGDKASLAETAWNLAQMNFYNLEAQAALEHAQQSLTLARELRLQELAARSLNVRAYAEVLLGQWAAVERSAQEGQALFAALSNRAMEVDCLCQITIARINSGRPEAGIRAGRMAQAISLEIGNIWGQIHSAVQLVPGLLDVGEYSEALTLAQQSVVLARSHNITFLLPICLMRLGTVYRTLWSLDMARTTLLEALLVNESNPAQPFMAAISAELCATCARAGSWPEAYTFAEQLFQAGKRTLIYTGFSGWLEVEALLQGGNEVKAQERLYDLSQQSTDNPRLRLTYLQALAVQTRWARDTGKAIAHLEAAIALAKEMGLPGEQWQILTRLGELYQLKGDAKRARAREAFERAREIVQALATKIDDEALRAEFLTAEPVQPVFQFHS